MSVLEVNFFCPPRRKVLYMKVVLVEVKMAETLLQIIFNMIGQKQLHIQPGKISNKLKHGLNIPQVHIFDLMVSPKFCLN